MGSTFKGKTKTVEEIQINKINEQGKVSFYAKHFINSYLRNAGNALETFKSLFTLRAKVTNKKILNKLGYLSTIGSIYSVTEQSLIKYLQSIGYKNIYINRMNILEYYLISDCENIPNMWSQNKEESILPQGNITGYCYLEWDGYTTRINKTDYLKYKELTNDNILIFKTLEIDPNITLTNDNYAYQYKDFVYTYNNNTYYDNITYTYHKYKLNGKTYQLVFSGSNIDYVKNNNTYTIKLKDSNNNIIDYTLPTNNTKYILVSFNCNEGSKYIIEPMDKIIECSNKNNTFLFIPIKHKGKIINKKNYQKVMLREFGILEPDESTLNDDRIYDLGFSLSSDLVTTNKQLNDSLYSVYGTNEHPKNVIIDTQIGQIEYKAENSYSSYNIIFNGVNISAKNNQYLVPLNALHKMNIKDFYNTYYSLLTSWIYVREKIKLHWYQTPTFNFILQTGSMFIAALTGNIEVFLIVTSISVATTYILNDILKDLGLSDDAIIIIDTIITIAVIVETGSLTNASNTAETTISSTVTTDINIVNTIANSMYKIELNNEQKSNIDIQKKYNEQVEKIKKEFSQRFLFEPFDMLDALHSFRDMDLMDQVELTNIYDPLPTLDY